MLESNAVPIHWKSLNKILPRRKAKSKDRAYTKEEIQKMLEVSNNITDKVLILEPNYDKQKIDQGCELLAQLFYDHFSKGGTDLCEK